MNEIFSAPLFPWLLIILLIISALHFVSFALKSRKLKLLFTSLNVFSHLAGIVFMAACKASPKTLFLFLLISCAEAFLASYIFGKEKKDGI